MGYIHLRGDGQYKCNVLSIISEIIIRFFNISQSHFICVPYFFHLHNDPALSFLSSLSSPEQADLRRIEEQRHEEAIQIPKDQTGERQQLLPAEDQDVLPASISPS
jgi:hypothetical protein